MLPNFDIYAAAGGMNIAVDRTLAATVTDGALNVTFGRVVDNPLISAVWAGASAATPTVVYTYRGDGLRNSKTVPALRHIRCTKGQQLERIDGMPLRRSAG